ncbi:MAG: 4Fe-4S binding protein [Nitrososphaerales archaeon]|jgi:pyruvate ferredoxin oxidoreductase delta subunit
MGRLPKWNEMQEGFITKTLSESINKTGTWRTFKPIIDYSRCTKCGWCVIYCPEPCISFESSGDGKVVIDYDFCKGCGICAEECPIKCIDMVMEE